MLPIIVNIALKFLLPELGVGFRGGGIFAAFVAVPEATVDEDDGAVFRQDNIRFPGQGFDVFAEAVARPVQHRADEHLRPRVFAFDAAHVP